MGRTLTVPRYTKAPWVPAFEWFGDALKPLRNYNSNHTVFRERIAVMRAQTGVLVFPGHQSCRVFVPARVAKVKVTPLLVRAQPW